MPALQGTNLQAAVVPNDSNDQFATHQAKWGQGGLQAVADLTGRDAITLERREFGMEVKVLANGKKYELKPTNQDLADNSNWQEVVAESGPAVTEWAAGPQKANSLVLYNGTVYLVKQDIANGQAAPSGNAQYYQPVGSDPNVVHLTGDETVAGNKTFTSPIYVAPGVTAIGVTTDFRGNPAPLIGGGDATYYNGGNHIFNRFGGPGTMVAFDSGGYVRATAFVGNYVFDSTGVNTTLQYNSGTGDMRLGNPSVHTMYYLASSYHVWTNPYTGKGMLLDDHGYVAVDSGLTAGQNITAGGFFIGDGPQLTNLPTIANTDALPEGSTNLYYTAARSAAKADLVNGKVPASQLPAAAAVPAVEQSLTSNSTVNVPSVNAVSTALAPKLTQEQVEDYLVRNYSLEAFTKEEPASVYTYNGAYRMSVRVNRNYLIPAGYTTLQVSLNNPYTAHGLLFTLRLSAAATVPLALRVFQPWTGTYSAFTIFPGEVLSLAILSSTDDTVTTSNWRWTNVANRAAPPVVSAALKATVQALSYSQGEAAAAAGSVHGMSFVTADYRYSYGYSSADTDGTLLVWSRVATAAGSGPANTDALPEGSTNLYYSATRAAQKADLVNSLVPAAQLPLATSTSAGTVTAGAGLTVAADGTLSNNAAFLLGNGNTQQPTVFSAAIGGSGNTIFSTLAQYSATLAGTLNKVRGANSVIAGGDSNTSLGAGTFIAASHNAYVTTNYTAVLGLNLDISYTIPALAAGTVVSNGFTFKYYKIATNNLISDYNFSALKIGNYGTLRLDGAAISTRYRGTFAATTIYAIGDLFKYRGGLYVVTADHISDSSGNLNTNASEKLCELSTPTTASIKSAVTAAGNTWLNGELQGTQPAGSVPGMKFCDANYRYEYGNGMNDTDGTSFCWLSFGKYHG